MPGVDCLILDIHMYIYPVVLFFYSSRFQFKEGSALHLVWIMDPTYPLVPIANFMACAFTVIPLFHMLNRSWNTGVFVFALWLFLTNFSTAVNTIIWSNDEVDRAPVWCNICKSSWKTCDFKDNYKSDESITFRHTCDYRNPGMLVCYNTPPL